MLKNEFRACVLRNRQDIMQICQVQGRVNFLSVEIYEKYQSSRLRLIFRGSFDFFPSKLTKYGNGNYIMLNRMNIFNVT